MSNYLTEILQRKQREVEKLVEPIRFEEAPSKKMAPSGSSQRLSGSLPQREF